MELFHYGSAKRSSHSLSLHNGIGPTFAEVVPSESALGGVGGGQGEWGLRSPSVSVKKEISLAKGNKNLIELSGLQKRNSTEASESCN